MLFFAIFVDIKVKIIYNIFGIFGRKMSKKIKYEVIRKWKSFLSSKNTVPQ